VWAELDRMQGHRVSSGKNGGKFSVFRDESEHSKKYLVRDLYHKTSASIEELTLTDDQLIRALISSS